ncbi:unnamed protein product, partial [Rangifer tarandus platyrhynchus]
MMTTRSLGFDPASSSEGFEGSRKLPRGPAKQERLSMWTLSPEARRRPRPPEWMPNTTCGKRYLLVHVRDPPRTAWTTAPQMPPCQRRVWGRVGSGPRAAVSLPPSRVCTARGSRARRGPGGGGAGASRVREAAEPKAAAEG